MYLQDFVSLKIGHKETLTLIIFELSFWRCELLKNYGRTVLRQCRADQNCVTIYYYKSELEDEEECHQCDSENVEE